MTFTDKVLVCRECGASFIFTSGEQEFFAMKGLQNEPGRCTDCRSVRRQQRDGGAWAIIAHDVRCTTPSALSADKLRRCLSSLAFTDQSIAAPASNRCALQTLTAQFISRTYKRPLKRTLQGPFLSDDVGRI